MPWLLVMRHGPAEASGIGGDAARRLSNEGRAQVQRAAAALAAFLPAPLRIYSSPLLRARETAACLADACGTEAPLATPLLAPGFDFAPLANELVRSRSGSMAIVGHEPDLSGFVAWQLGMDRRACIHFGKGAACLLEFARPREVVLHGLYPLETFQGL